MVAAVNCVSPHLLSARDDAEEIAWFAVTVDSARVIEHSCSFCPGPGYELCVLGARWFIRRTSRKGTHETMRWRERTTRRLWAELFAGVAR
jgi:hypothetical protein